MIVFTLAKRFNQWLGPFLLKNGLKARCALGGGLAVGHQPSIWDDTTLLPVAQWLISVSLHDTANQVVEAATCSKQGQRWSDYFFHLSQEELDAQKLTSDQLRLAVLEKYVRAALVPNERWSDVQRWQFHSPLAKWARFEYLKAKHFDVAKEIFWAFPELRQAKQIQRRQHVLAKLVTGKLPLGNHRHDNSVSTSNKAQGALNFLPKTDLVKRAFGMQKWATGKNPGVTYKCRNEVARKLGGSVIELRGGGICLPDIPGDANLKALSMGEILELVGGLVLDCGPFNLVCEEAGIFQLWTKEYIEELGNYLLTRAKLYQGKTLILDVGAGDGLLAEALRRYFDHETTASAMHQRARNRRTVKDIRITAVGSVPTVIATDDGSWDITQKANVEKMGYDQAIEKYCGSKKDKNNGTISQVIVLCSWMPMNEDWSATFRKYQVDEYILIGECDNGQCGDNWKTWGNPQMQDDSMATTSHDGNEQSQDNDSIQTKPELPLLPSYEQDGYQRKDLENLSLFQFSRFDSLACKSGRTVSFRKNNVNAENIVP